MKLFQISFAFCLIVLMSACLGGKKLIEKEAVSKTEKPSINKALPPKSGNIYAQKPVSSHIKEKPTSPSNPTERVSEDRGVIVPLNSANALNKNKLEGHDRKATFQSKSICEMQPLIDWHYSYSDAAPATFKECKTYPPEQNFERYLKKQKIHDVGEISRKVIHKNLTGVLKHAVKTGEIMSTVCFNREGVVVASKVVECSINYTRDRLEGYQDALLDYKWSGNRSAPPIECMKIFFSTSLQ